MYSPELSIKDLLVTALVGTTTGATGWQIRIGAFPLAPDTCLVIFRTGGREPNPRYLLNEITAQIQVRGDQGGYAATSQKAIDVQDALVGLPPQTINGDRWDGIYGMGDIAFLQYDDQDRPIFVVNIRALIEPAASALTHRESLG